MEIQTDLAADELRPRLESWGPWRLEIQFSNGLNTLDFGRGTPFQPDPLSKMRAIESAIDLAEFRGGRAIDVGVNSGYNTLHLAAEYEMRVHGIDITTRHLEVSAFILEAAGLADKCVFERADATTYRTPEAVDVVLHLGTLYHLPNPLLSIENTAANLRSGGLLALETQIYIGEDQTLSKFIRGFRGDHTNFWALSRQTLCEILDMYGFHSITVIKETDPDFIGDNMARILLIARRK